MSNHIIKRTIEKLRAAGFDDKEAPFIGCSNVEIGQLEKHYGFKLPNSYKQFLSVMGKDCGNFLLGYDYSYDVLFTLTAGCQEIAAEDPDCTFRLSPTDFVFISSQGSQFLFFDTASGDDPVVRYFLEGEKPEQKYESFSKCLDELANLQIAAARERANR